MTDIVMVGTIIWQPICSTGLYGKRKVASEYSKKDIPCYYDTQFPKFLVTGHWSLVPKVYHQVSIQLTIDWEDAKKQGYKGMHPSPGESQKNFEIQNIIIPISRMLQKAMTWQMAIGCFLFHKLSLHCLLETGTCVC